MKVAVTQVNDVPVITSVAPVSATEDVEYSYQVDVEDPDNTNFEFTLDNAPDGMAVSDSGLILWTPLEGVTTSGVVTLTVDDGDLIAVEVFEVAVTQVNDVPVITSVAPASATEDIEYSYQVDVETQIILVLNLL